MWGTHYKDREMGDEVSWVRNREKSSLPASKNVGRIKFVGIGKIDYGERTSKNRAIYIILY